MSAPTTNVPGTTGLIPTQHVDTEAANTGVKDPTVANLKISSFEKGAPPVATDSGRYSLSAFEKRAMANTQSGSGTEFKGIVANQRDGDLPNRLSIQSFGSGDTVNIKGTDANEDYNNLLWIPEKGVDERGSGVGLGIRPNFDSYRLDHLDFSDRDTRTHADSLDPERDLAELKALGEEAHKRVAEFIKEKHEYNQQTGAYKREQPPIRSISDLGKRLVGLFNGAATSLMSFAKDPMSMFRKTPELTPPELPRWEDGTLIDLIKIDNEIEQLEILLEELSARPASEDGSRVSDDFRAELDSALIDELEIPSTTVTGVMRSPSGDAPTPPKRPTR
ncbi:hypothetical protein [Cognatiyoonia sp. IB215182]|uniref:hypothetical protein n=1 Tax=Cognatiyoonia sp. IB215182 TaxID=3097353 RepID=UPI002A0E0104|nr:hypothetical protein [Cognatiyoonia sp. IB215182]MDX8352054.1 hypothetical protein [Cognatiyoonia sp. IB215182]